MIPEPQRTYLLELMKALGPMADDFVIAGAQALKFVAHGARATKDIDFILDVVNIRHANIPIRPKLNDLGYQVVESARNFQFEKPIAGTVEKIRIELMSPEEFKRQNDFRVDIGDDLHARACTGGTIAIAESAFQQVSGTLPDGSPFTLPVRVTKPHALIMLKLLALDDRHQSARGPRQAQHDREVARTHAADVVTIVNAQTDLTSFNTSFQAQFGIEMQLGLRVMSILRKFFDEDTSPGLLYYEEHLAVDLPPDRDSRRRLGEEIDRAHKMMRQIIPNKAFFELLSLIEESTDAENITGPTGEYLAALNDRRIRIDSSDALAHLPPYFGASAGRGEQFSVSTPSVLDHLSPEEHKLIEYHHRVRASQLVQDEELRKRFPHALALVPKC